MLSAARAQRSCPQCRRQVLSLFERTFAHTQSEAPVLTRYQHTPRHQTARLLRTNSRCFSTTRARFQNLPPEGPPESSPGGQPEAERKAEAETVTDAVTDAGPEYQPRDTQSSQVDEIELLVRQARQAFGNTLPKGYLNEKEYKLYLRLYGPPLRETQPEDVGMPIPPDALGEEYVYESSEKVLLREGEDGQMEEIVYEAEESTYPPAPSSAEDADEVATESASGDIVSRDLPSEAGLIHVHAVAKNQREFDVLLKLQKDFETASLRPAEEDIEEDEPQEDQEREEDEADEEDKGEPDVMFSEQTDRVHKFSRLGHWRTYPNTLQLPKADFVTPITNLLGRTDIKHVKDAAEKAFGGPGLPLSVATRKRNAQQEPISLAAGHHKMGEIEADVFIATLLPGMYSSTMSVLVEVRRRLGSDWMAKLMTRGNGEGPRVLDVGAGGAGLVAWEQVLQAEWDRAREAGQKKGSAPPGRKTVIVGSELLRQRVSRFLHNTTFLPRLPDYLHSGDHPSKLEGGEAQLPRKQFDIIIASHQMMPIMEGFKRKAMLDNLWEMLSPDGGVLIVLEKGHPRGFEAVAHVRARLLDEFIVSPDADPRPEHQDLEPTREREPGMIIAPCTNHKACPMYRTPGLTVGRKDFCHFSQRFIRPTFLQRALGANHRNHEDIDFSFIAVQRGALPGMAGLELPAQGHGAAVSAFRGYETSLEAPDPLSLPRVILPPLKRKKHVMMDLCTPAGVIERWTVPMSFSKQAYRDARKAKWGDLWALGAKTRTERAVRLGKGGPAPNDGGVRAQRAAQAGKARVVTLNADSSGIYSAREAGRAQPRRRTKGGRKGKPVDLLKELEQDRLE